MAKFTPSQGKGGNLLAWMDGIGPKGFGVSPTEFMRKKMEMNQRGITNYDEEDLVRLSNLQGGSRFAKAIKAARYNWLFDDLQRFEQIDEEQIQSKEDLDRFIQESLKSNKGFESQGAGRQSTWASRLSNEMWTTGGIREVARDNVVRQISDDEKDFIREQLPEKKKQTFARVAPGNKVFRVNRQELFVERRDKKGRRFFQSVNTGRRGKSPERLLREKGF